MDRVVVPEISIIVPVYKVEECIDRCIQSILNQTFKDFELILVDDGSPDKCGEICDRYCRLDKRIKVIHKENGGLSSARNAGLDIARGKYIGFVDSDDYIHPQMYEVLKSSIEKNNSDISMCGYIYGYAKDYKFLDVLKCKYTNYNSKQALSELYGRDSVIFVVAWNKLYISEIFNDIRYPNGRIHEDEFIAPKLMYKAKKITYCEDKLYYYYQRENSIMRSKFSMKRVDKLYYNVDRIKFFKDIKDKQLKNNAIYVFVNNFFDIYCKMKFDLKCDKYKLRKVKSLFISSYIDILKSKKFNIKEKILMFLFIMNDKLYFNYMKKKSGYGGVYE